MRSLSLFSIVLIFAAALGVAPPVRAGRDTKATEAAADADANDLEALLGESVVTTASRAAERASVAPATVYTITADEIHRSGVRTVDEALEFLGLGLYVSKPRDYVSGIDVGGQGVLLRQSRHVLVMLDGVILNSQGTGRISLHEGLGVPLDFIDHIEVMLGPGSVMYGSNAVLAVINIVTRRARDLGHVRATAELGSSAPQDTNGNPLSGVGGRAGLRDRAVLGFSQKFSLWGKPGEVAMMGEWSHESSATYGVTPFTMGLPDNQSFYPGTTVWGGLTTQSMYAPSGVLTAQLGEFRLLLNGFYYFRNMPLVGTFNDPYSREAQNGVRFDLSHSHRFNPRLTLDTRLYGGYAGYAERSNYGEAFWCISGQNNGCHFQQSASSEWFGLEQRLGVDWLTDGRVATTVGYDLRPLFFDSRPGDYLDLVTNLPPDNLALPHPHNISFLGAVFAQQIYRPLSWLALNLGGRLDIAGSIGVHFSPRAAVVVTPGSTTVLRASYNEAFRAPSEHELTEFDPTYRITPMHLNPETVRSVEVEVQQRVWRLQFAVRGYAAFYYNLIDARTATAQEIAPFLSQLSPTIDPSVVQVNDNVEGLQVLGGSATATLRLPAGLSLRGSVNYAHTQDGANEMSTPPRLPSVFGNFRAAWESEGGYSLMLLGVYTNDRPITDTTWVTPYTLGPRLDLRLSVAGPFSVAGKIPGLRFRAALGFDVNPWLPYVVTTKTDTPLTYVLYPDQPRLFGFIGLSYTFSP